MMGLKLRIVALLSIVTAVGIGTSSASACAEEVGDSFEDGRVYATVSDGVTSVKIGAFDWSTDAVYLTLPGDKYWSERISGQEVDVEVDPALLKAHVRASGVSPETGRTIAIDIVLEGMGAPTMAGMPGAGAHCIDVWVSTGTYRRSASGMGSVSVTGTVELVDASASADMTHSYFVHL